MDIISSHVISCHATDLFPSLAFAVEGCSENKVSWYSVLSKLLNYLPEDWRFCRFVVPKIIHTD